MRCLYLIAVFSFFFLLNLSDAAGQFKGIVFHDQNGNGLKEANETGIQGAVVSDGYHVVQTNQAGEYQLQGWKKQQFITLYPRSEMACSERFKSIISDNAKYDFPVLLKEKKNKVTFLQISDTESYEFRNWVIDLKQYIKNHSPDFVVHTGDICYQSGMQWHSENLNKKQLGVPIYYCLGNHDLIKGKRGEEFFEPKIWSCLVCF